MLKRIVILFAMSLSLIACKTATHGKLGNEPQNTLNRHNSKVMGKIFTILDVTGGTDGDSVILRDKKGMQYHAILSIPNLGMHSTYDHSQTKIGAVIRVDGEVFRMGNRVHLHITRAVNIIKR